MRKELPVLTCDRCDHVETITVPHKEHLWGRITAGPVNGAQSMVLANQDICPGCVNAMLAWWKAGKEKANGIN